MNIYDNFLAMMSHHYADICLALDFECFPKEIWGKQNINFVSCQENSLGSLSCFNVARICFQSVILICGSCELFLIAYHSFKRPSKTPSMSVDRAVTDADAWDNLIAYRKYKIAGLVTKLTRGADSNLGTMQSTLVIIIGQIRNFALSEKN